MGEFIDAVMQDDFELGVRFVDPKRNEGIYNPLAEIYPAGT